MLAQIAADTLLKRMDRLGSGSFEITLPNGQTYMFEGETPGAHAQIEFKSWQSISNLATKGNAGFAEDYNRGLWETKDIVNLLTVGLQNEDRLKNFVIGSTLGRLMAQVSYLFKMNTVQGSKRNIHAHYDLGNAFYSLWLDRTMTYSSALFKAYDETLEAAQHNKYDRMIERFEASSGRLLEIGCGWGGFAERAAETGDFDIKSITISQEQHDFARTRLGNKANVALEDYRHQDGRFDNIASIEMFEAVGEQYWPTYFKKVGSLLKNKGRAVIQTITIDDGRFQKYRRGSDVFRSFIFPGGMLPSPARFKAEAEKAGLRQNDYYFFGKDYARTIEHWLHNFDEKIHEMKAMGFDDAFIRLWRFYLAACIAGFRCGRTDVMQVELQRI